MPRNQRIRSKSGYYHIMLRGNEKKNIFMDEEDKLRFLDTLYIKMQDNRYNVHAFCLMDNHVHLLISEGQEDIAKVMKRITVSYVYYFNQKYKRTGHLFQDRFKSEAVNEERYILSLVRYIHKNPVKAGLVSLAGDYKWSSYDCYFNDCNYFNRILDKHAIMALFADDDYTAKRLFEEFMNEEANDCFIDLPQEDEIISEEEARSLLNILFAEFKIKSGDKIPNELIREFKLQTKLSIRKIAALTNLSKDKVNKILKET